MNGQARGKKFLWFFLLEAKAPHIICFSSHKFYIQCFLKKRLSCPHQLALGVKVRFLRPQVIFPLLMVPLSVFRRILLSSGFLVWNSSRRSLTWVKPGHKEDFTVILPFQLSFGLFDCYVLFRLKSKGSELISAFILLPYLNKINWNDFAEVQASLVLYRLRFLARSWIPAQRNMHAYFTYESYSISII